MKRTRHVFALLTVSYTHLDVYKRQVLFSGNYALSKKNERLSDLIAKAGGVTPDAYVKGARLIRRMTERCV